MDSLIGQACHTYRSQRALGHEVTSTELATMVRNPRYADTWDANHVCHVRAASDAALDRLFQSVEEHFAHCDHRQYFCDPLTPPRLEARLLQQGFAVTTTVQLLLTGSLQSLAGPPPAGLLLRPVETEADWHALYLLRRLDHLEADALHERPGGHPEHVSQGLHQAARAKAPAMTYWIASLDGQDVAYGATYLGDNPVGMVEDLFTRADRRHQGIASALMAHLVSDLRQRGAGPVLIGGILDDTPRHMYQAMGFAPLMLSRAYVNVAHRG